MAQAMLKPSLQGELQTEMEIKAPATKFYNMFAVTPQDVSKATPENIKACHVEQGEVGRVGTLLSWNYVEDGKSKMSKERIEAVEPKKNMIKFRVIEGDLMEEFKSFVTTIQVTPKQGGPGGMVKWLMEYERIDENVAHPENLLQYLVKMSEDIDAMLLSRE